MRGNNDKVFIIYVDQTVGSAITMFMREISKERPLTHDLIAHLMTALGARVETGVFGADMKVSLTNDGPVTLLIDSRRAF